jgi:hypothetical protein
MSGKTFVTTTALGTLIGAAVLSPSAFGNRVAVASGIFARWRIVKLIIKTPSDPAATPLYTAIGVSDDDGAEGGSVPAPTTAQEIVELRCSIANFSQVNPSEFVWTPVDKSRWYYTQQGGSSADNRFVIPGTLFVSSSTAGFVVNCLVYYTIEFEGGFDNSS